MRKTMTGIMMAAGILGTGASHAYSIDGNLSDWGMNASTLKPGIAVDFYAVEDQTGSSSTYLNPGYGGQAYDAEAIYLTWDSSNLYIAIITGHNPNTPNSGGSYGAGDIAIDFGSNGSWDYGIELLGGGGLNQGHVYANTNWSYGLWTSTGAYTSNPATADPAHPTSLVSGTDVGTGSVAYTTTGVSGLGAYTSDLHYFYEVSVPLSAFGNSFNTASTFTVHWTMNCANDAISVQGGTNSVFRVPEPGTLALLPLGMIGLLTFRRRKSA